MHSYAPTRKDEVVTTTPLDVAATKPLLRLCSCVDACATHGARESNQLQEEPPAPLALRPSNAPSTALSQLANSGTGQLLWLRTSGSRCCAVSRRGADGLAPPPPTTSMPLAHASRDPPPRGTSRRLKSPTRR